MAFIEDLTPDMQPLKQSAAFDDVEDELKSQFIQLFQDYLREPERDLNVYGVPHLGSLSLIEKHVRRDGLALIRSDEPSMKYLYRAWKSRNQKRGFHFLRTYLQLLWPDGWVVDQLWQDKSQTYPVGLSARSAVTSVDPHTTHFLTSRVRVSIDSADESGLNIPIVQPALRSVLAARFVLQITILRRFENIGDNGLGFANASAYGTAGSFDGTASLPDFSNQLGFASVAMYGSVASFGGESALGSSVVP